MELQKTKDLNILLLGLGFLFVYTAYQTTAAVSETVLNSFEDETGKVISGYIAMALNYAGTTMVALFVPGMLLFITRKTSIIIGSVLSITMAAAYIYPTAATIYIFSFLSGVGGAFIWVGQGAEVLANSDEHTVDRNTAVFWLLYQMSQFGGNLYVYIAWGGYDIVTSTLRITLFSILVGVGSLGILTFTFIRVIPSESDITDDTLTLGTKIRMMLKTIGQAVRYCGQYHFIMLILITSYIGFELAFFQMIFPTCVANTKAFGDDSEKLTGLVVCFIGVGEIVGSFSSGALSKIGN